MTNKRAAVLAEARLREEFKGRLTRAGSVTRMTVEAAIQRYMAERLKPKVRPVALATYLGIIREFFGPATPVENIGAARGTEWWGTLLERVKPNSARRYLTALKSLFNFARSAGAGNEVPTFNPKIGNDARVRWLRDEEEQALLAACPNWLRELVVFYLETGARKSEAPGLRWGDVDLDRQSRGLVRFYVTKGGEPRGGASLGTLRRSFGESPRGGQRSAQMVRCSSARIATASKRCRWAISRSPGTPLSKRQS